MARRIDDLSDQELEKLATGLRKGLAYRSTHVIEFFKPYPKQLEFFAAGAKYRERLYQAGNQLFGKTTAGAVETAYHLTGLYPGWWPGWRCNHPTKGWAYGESGVWIRDQAQSRLCGDHAKAWGPEAPGWGTGFIPKEMLLGRTLTHGVQNGFDSISVKHVSGGTSSLAFKSYEQGREKAQGATLDFVWPDECPPDDIYGELMARITMTDGRVFVTFTPMKGATGVTARFTDDDSPEAIASRICVRAGIKDIVGKTPEEIAIIAAGYKAHERAARMGGAIMMGEGAVFEDVSPEMITVPGVPLSQVPLHWRKIWGIDFGIGHPFAAVLLAHDPDTDIIYVIHEIKIADVLPMHHVAMIRGVAPMPPVAWPHDGIPREKSSGVELHKFYRAGKGQPGLAMRMDFARMSDGGYSTGAGVTEMLTRMRQGKLLVFDTCRRWLAEFSSYHRKDGVIVKVNDDLMSATRQGVIDIRFAKSVPLGPGAPGAGFASQRPRQQPELDIFTGQPIY